MLRFILASAVIATPFSLAPAADTKAIDQAIDKGKAFLKGHFASPKEDATEHYGIGPAAFAGVALLEARVPADDPTIKAITAAVREASYTRHETYQTALCIIYLDKLEDPADVPLIQMLAVRLLAGQQSNGGWSYNTCGAVGADHVQWLKANLKAEAKGDGKTKPTPRLLPEVQTYAASIQKPAFGPDDNSNTQFAILGLWLVRKHGVPVEGALDLIDKRFRAMQDPQGGGWYYINGMAPTASMTCCGLLGLATGNARRIEKRPKLKDATLKTPTAKEDPFFTPGKGAEKPPAEKAPETQDPAALRGLATLGRFVAAFVQNGGVLVPGQTLGDRDYYLLWSIERVGVLYNVDKIGGVDWYDVGSDALVKGQGANGAWGGGRYGEHVNTTFALLFLCKADLLRDLSNKFKKDNELRAGNSGSGNNGGTEVSPMPKNGSTGPNTPALPVPVEDAAAKLASSLVRAPATDWTKTLEAIRDAKGADNTRGLVIAIQRLDGDRKKEARNALAERLTRMSADTLKGMMAAEDAELRRGAALAAAMKDDKTHVPDLIDRLLDDEEAVVRAASAGLKSLTSQDFGPKKGATKDECKAAAAAWKAWWAKNKN